MQNSSLAPYAGVDTCCRKTGPADLAIASDYSSKIMDQELIVKRVRWNKALHIYNTLGQLVQQLPDPSESGLKSSIWLRAEIWS